MDYPPWSLHKLDTRVSLSVVQVGPWSNSIQCPLWVKSRHVRRKNGVSALPPIATSIAFFAMSAWAKSGRNLFLASRAFASSNAARVKADPRCGTQPVDKDAD